MVVNRSTVPVGSGDYVSMLIRDGIEEAGGEAAAFPVASNPEFLREGSAIYDSLSPHRIVVDSRGALDALSGPHAAVVVTEWEEFRTLDPASAPEAGLAYRGFGRG